MRGVRTIKKAPPVKAAPATEKRGRTVSKTATAKRTARSAPRKAERETKPAAKPTTPRVPVISKGEMRGQMEKLERTVDTLRGKGREAAKAAKVSAKRIADLESQVASLEKQLAATHEDSTARELRSLETGDIVSTSEGAVDVGSAWEAEEPDAAEPAEDGADAEMPGI